MRYNTSINNVKAKEWGLNLPLSYLFAWFYELPSWANKVVIENEIYYFASKNKAVEELPLLTDKRDTMYRYYKQIENLGLIKIKKVDDKDYICLTKKAMAWNYSSDTSETNPTNLGNKSEQTSDINPTYNNTILNNNTKDNRKKNARFVPPTIEDIFNYMTEEKGKEKSFAKKESEKMFNLYESKGWIVGKAKMKNWKAAASGWIARSEDEFKSKDKPAFKLNTNRPTD